MCFLFLFSFFALSLYLQGGNSPLPVVSPGAVPSSSGGRGGISRPSG